MIRVFNALAVVVVFVAGFALYRMKFETQQLQEHASKLSQQIVDDQAEIKVLNAEWAYLSSPQRLEQLASRYLSLQPAGPDQVALAVANIQTRPAALPEPALLDDASASQAETQVVQKIRVEGGVKPATPSSGKPLLQVAHQSDQKIEEPQPKPDDIRQRKAFNPLTGKLHLISSDGEHP